MPIAQIRYDDEGLWTLYFGDRNGRWTRYSYLDPERSIDVVIDEINQDPTALFWG